MTRPNLRLLGLLASVLLVPHGSWAAPPNTSPGNETDIGSPSVQSDPAVTDFQSLGVSRRLTLFSGTILDVNDHPLPGVEVKLFMDGQLAGSGLTEGNGYYELRVPYDSNADATVLLWFVAPDRSLVPKMLVLRESRVTRDQALISTCVPRATPTPGRQFRVYLFDSQSRNKELSEMNCLP